MIPNIESALPPEWRLLFRILTLPIAWIPPVQAAIVGFLWDFSSPLGGTLKLTLFLLPALHVVAGMWCTMFSIYTLPFRGGRHQFVAVVLTTWWDSGRAIGMFWIGMFRALFLSAGWVWGLIRILAAGIYLALADLVTLPFSLIRRATQSSLRPGIPWIAVALTLLWSLLEAGVFSYTLYPMVSDIASDLVGGGPHPLLQPALFFVLFLLIAGSFACLQVMVEAIKQRNWKDIVQMVLVELFVMFFEVVFLYRELVDAITPVLALQSGGQVRIGVAAVLLISTLAWIGIRGMTWFLFAGYGTPTLRAIISGQGITAAPVGERSAPGPVASWTKEMLNQIKADIEWFHTTGTQLLEAYVLPPLQLIAGTINFFMVLVAGRHLFRLPLNSLHAFMETGELVKLARAESHASGTARGR
ncbi:MAG: hypothetical protein ACE5IQ_12710 [Candidatus Methylomirabilales bacterium]